MSNKNQLIWICLLTQIGLLITGSVLTYRIDYYENTDIFTPLTIFIFLALPHFLLSRSFGSVSMGTLSLWVGFYFPLGLWALIYTALVVHAAFQWKGTNRERRGLEFSHKHRYTTQHTIALSTALMCLGVLGLNSSGVIPGQPIHLWGHDTLLHSAIAELFKNYGVSTIGLTDLRPISYHTFSHEVFARISRLSGLQITVLYAWVPIAILGPILLSVAAEFANHHAEKKSDGFYIVLKVVIALAAIRALAMVGFPTFDSFLASESFAVGLISLISALNITNNIEYRARWWSTSSKVALVTFGTFASAASKISLILAALAILTYLAFPLVNKKNKKLNNKFKIIISIIIALAAALVVKTGFKVTEKISTPSDFDSFYLFRNYGSLPFQDNGIELVSVISMWIGVVTCFLPILFYLYKSRFFRRAKIFIGGKMDVDTLTPLDFLMLSAIPSFLIGMFMPLFGGSGTYFLLPFLFLSIVYAIVGMNQILTVGIALFLSWNFVSANSSWANAFMANTAYIAPFPSTDIEIDYIEKLNSMEHYEDNSAPIDFSDLRNDAEKIWNCRGFYLPQVITGRSLSDGIPYGWRVPDCWYWPAGQRGLSDYPERLKVSLEEYMQHPHKSVRLVLQRHAVVENLAAAQQWEALQ